MTFKVLPHYIVITLEHLKFFFVENSCSSICRFAANIYWFSCWTFSKIFIKISCPTKLWPYLRSQELVSFQDWNLCQFVEVFHICSAPASFFFSLSIRMHGFNENDCLKRALGGPWSILIACWHPGSTECCGGYDFFVCMWLYHLLLKLVWHFSTLCSFNCYWLSP